MPAWLQLPSRALGLLALGLLAGACAGEPAAPSEGSPSSGGSTSSESQASTTGGTRTTSSPSASATSTDGTGTVGSSGGSGSAGGRSSSATSSASAGSSSSTGTSGTSGSTTGSTTGTSGTTGSTSSGATTSSSGGLLSGCLTRGDNASIPFRLMQNGPPPALDSSGDYPVQYTYYPANDYSTTQVDKLGPAPQGQPSGYVFKKRFWLWANRCIYMPGISPSYAACENRTVLEPNDYSSPRTFPDGGQLRPAFSTYVRANACTMLQAQFVLHDMDAGALEGQAQAAGLTLWPSADDFSDRPGLDGLASSVRVMPDGGSERYLVDVCILEPHAQAADSDGLLLDWEVHDVDSTVSGPRGADGGRMTTLIYPLNDLVRDGGGHLYVYTNNLIYGASRNDLSPASIRALLFRVRGFSPLVYSGATLGVGYQLTTSGSFQNPITDLEHQLAYITDGGAVPLTTGQRRRMFFTVSLLDSLLDGGVTDAGVQLGTGQQAASGVRDIVIDGGYGGVVVWRNGASLSGDCTTPEHRYLACLANGTCGP